MRMQESLRERIEKLREEIAKIREANRVYWRGGKKPPGTADHQRRRERLQQIVDELSAFADWKRP